MDIYVTIASTWRGKGASDYSTLSLFYLPCIVSTAFPASDAVVRQVCTVRCTYTRIWFGLSAAGFFVRS